MKKLFVLLGALGMVLMAFSQNLQPRIDSIVNAYTNTYKFNGSVLIAQKGTVILHKGYGLRDATSGERNTANTVFQIGSVTKQFTAAIIQKLQEEKKLSVQDKVSKYFPDYPRGDSITIEQLLTHTSGIYSYTSDRNFMATEVAKPQSREKMMSLFKNKPLDFTPGTRWAYSNSAYVLLGYIIEDVTKKPYEQVVREYIFKPVQMTHSGFDFTHLQSPDRATAYFVLNDVDSVKSPIVDSTVAYSAGSIYSTTGDLFKWHKALQNYSILSKPLQEKAYTVVKNNYGYGWVIDSVESKRRVAHSGGIHGFTSNFTRIPEEDIVIILLSNNASPSLYEMSNKIISAFYNKPYDLPSVRKAVLLGDEKLKDYVGEYEINPQLQLKLSIKDGQLWAEPTGQKATTVYAEKEDVFYAKSPDVQLQFKRNDKKEVTGFTLHQNGQTVDCRKLK